MRRLLALIALLALAGPPALATPATTITVTWSDDGRSVHITSDKDLSNVVVEDCAGTRHKHDGLNDGDTGTFTHPSGGIITTVWVKSGNNDSGDGPGYGERFTNPDKDACGADTTTTTAAAPTTTTTAAAGTTTTAAPTTTTTLAPVVIATPTDVQGATLTRPETLPKTGAGVWPSLLMAGIALTAGGAALRAGRPKD